MVISFSGLGGSGKTTQIARLEQNLKEQGYRPKIVVLREKFFWPRLARLLKPRRETYSSEKLPLEKTSNLKTWLRLGFYFFDSWRIYFSSVFLSSLIYDILILDRTFFDFFLELDFPKKRLSRPNLKFMRFLPKPDALFFLKISSETAYKRKSEWLPSELEGQTKVQEGFFLNQEDPEPILINGEAAEEKVAHTVWQVVLAIINSRKKFALPSWLLFEFLAKRNSEILAEKILLPNFSKLFRLAARNRCLWKLAQQLENLNLKLEPEVQTLAEDIKTSGRKILKEKQNSLSILEDFRKETGVKFQVLKEHEEFELGSDLDVFFENENGFSKAIAYFVKHGKVKTTSSTKADVEIENALPLDFHLDLTYNDFRYASSEFLFSHPNEANLLILASHSLNETTLITLGDVLEAESLRDQIFLEEVLKEAKRYRWNQALAKWLALARPKEEEIFRYPYPLPVSFLLRIKFQKYLAAPSRKILPDFWNFLRSLRARRLGKIPFHEPWFSFSRFV